MRVPSEFEKFRCNWKILAEVGKLKWISIQLKTFQLHQPFSNFSRTFQHRPEPTGRVSNFIFFQFHVKLSISMIFPTKQSNYTNPGGTLWSWKVTFEVGQLLDQSFPTSFRPFQLKLLSYGVLSNAKFFNCSNHIFQLKRF